MRCVCYKVEKNEDNMTVDSFLRKKGVSRRVIIDLKKEKDGITKNGQWTRTIDRLHTDDEVMIKVREYETSEHILPQNIPLDVVYVDEDIMVIIKPAGISVHPTPRHRENTVANALAYRAKQQNKDFVFRAIGRLDKNTSGLLVLAQNALSAGILSDMSAKKLMKREYLAICRGETPKEGTINAPIKRKADLEIERIVAPDGERAVTHFRRIAFENGFSLVHLWLETGRTHQIRVHMKHIGFPLMGDFVYNPDYEGISRHALHAGFLTVPKLITGEERQFFAPLPQDMQGFFPNITEEKLRKLCGK